MKSEIREIYRCEYCKLVRLQKRAMVLHERFCMKNPYNVPMCFKGANGCKHFKNWTCLATGAELCTAKWLHLSRGRVFDSDKALMPMSCDKYEKAPTHEDYFLSL